MSGKPSIFKVLIDPAKALVKTADDYRKRQFLKFVADDVRKASFAFVDRSPVVIERRGDGEWTVNGKPADRPFVETVLRNLSELKASSFPKKKEGFGFDAPRLRATVELKAPDGKESTRVLVVGAKADGGYHAATDDLKEPFIVAEEDLKRIEPREETLVQPAASPEPLLAPSASPSPAH